MPSKRGVIKADRWPVFVRAEEAEEEEAEEEEGEEEGEEEDKGAEEEPG